MFAIARVIQKDIGTEDERYSVDVTLSQIGTSCRCIIPSNADGTPRFNFALVETDDPSPIGTNLFTIPEILNTELRDINAVRRNAINDKLTNAGVDTSSLTGTNTIKDVLRLVGRHLDINFRRLAGVDFG